MKVNRECEARLFKIETANTIFRNMMQDTRLAEKEEPPVVGFEMSVSSSRCVHTDRLNDYIKPCLQPVSLQYPSGWLCSWHQTRDIK